MLAARGLRFRYPGADREALRGIDLEIVSGRVTALLGRSGGGKSTLLACLSGLLEPTGGSVALEGRPPRAGDVGLVLQIPEHQIVAATVERELAFGLEVRSMPRPAMRARVAEAADALGLAGRLADRPSRLSAGERQRLVCGAVLASGPGYLLLDEATSLLDVSGREAVRALVAAEAARGTAVLLVTQFPDESLWADAVAVLDEGAIVAHGRPRSVAASGAPAAGQLRVRTEAARLAELLEAAGVPLPPGLLTVEDLASALRPLLASHADRVADTVARGTVSPGLPATKPPLLALDDVSFGEPGSKQRLQGVSLSLGEGDCVVLLGPSGSGKTTLLLVAAGVLPPRSGAVRLAPGSGAVGFALQCPERQFACPTARGEIALCAGAAAAEDGSALAICERLGLRAEHLARSPFHLSAGEQRRLAIAAQLARRPRILLLDEPTAGLDPDARRELLAVLEGVRRQGTALLVASQDPAVAAGLDARVLVLHEGSPVPRGGEELGLPAWSALAAALGDGSGDRDGIATYGESDFLAWLAARARSPVATGHAAGRAR